MIKFGAEREMNSRIAQRRKCHHAQCRKIRQSHCREKDRSSDWSIKVKLPARLGNYDRNYYKPTTNRKTDKETVWLWQLWFNMSSSWGKEKRMTEIRTVE